MFAFFALDGGAVEVEGRLGERRPTKASAAGNALWEAVHADSELVELLRERRYDLRHAGPFILGAAYEKARFARRAGASPADAAAPHGGARPHNPMDSDVDGGYLLCRLILEALVRRLFDTGERLHAAWVTLQTAWWSWIHVETRGAFAREAWARVDDDPTCIELFATTDDEAPWLVLTIAPLKEVSLERWRQRCALGVPLLGGTSLPTVHRVRPEQTFHPPDADDMRLAVALAEALLAVSYEEVLGVSGAPCVVEHHVELDAGALDVRLTASHAEAPWDDEHEEEKNGGDLNEDEENSSTISADPLVEAFTDAALDRGLARDWAAPFFPANNVTSRAASWLASAYLATRRRPKHSTRAHPRGAIGLLSLTRPQRPMQRWDPPAAGAAPEERARAGGGASAPGNCGSAP